MILRQIFLTILVGTTLALSGCGGGGEDGESTAIASSTPVQAQRLALKAEDITKDYYESMSINPRVDNIMGALTYSITDSAPDNIAQIDTQTGQISVFSPGIFTVEVTDTSMVFEDSTARFTVTIDKGITYDLSAQSKYISVDSVDNSVLAENNKGSVTYRVADDSRSLLNIDPESGKLEPLNVGTATVIIEDAGNEKYVPASTTAIVTIKAITAGTIECADFTNVLYSEGLTLSPNCLSGDDGIKYSYKIYSGGNIDQDVIDIDSQSGLMTVKKVGSTVVEVTANYDDRYNKDSEKIYFHVDILQGQRQQVRVEEQTLTYSAGEIIQPNVTNNVGVPRYEVETGHDVITINDATGYPQIIGVGSAKLRVTDDSNSNYKISRNSFSYTVDKAPHPGLNSDTVIKRSYTEDLIITPEIEGQKGTLVIKSDSPAVVISGHNVAVKQAGRIELTVNDSGDELYLESKAVPLILDIALGDHPAMTVTGLTTDYKAGCFAISLNVQGNKGKLAAVANSDESVAKYNKELNCINLFKAGSTTLSLYSEASANYKASEPVDVPVIVNKVGSTLKASGDVSGSYSAQSHVQTPTISGHAGRDLLFEFAPESATDVVEIDNLGTSGGTMKVLNAGTTQIKVTDSGTEQHEGSTVYFNVTVSPAENRLSVAYPTTVFESGKAITPVFSNSANDMAMAFELISGNDAVELVNSRTGELKIIGGGDYSLKVTASSRNYAEKVLTVKGSVTKALHPGLATPTVNVEYAPLKKYNLNPATPAIGKRVFAIDSGQTKGLAEINPNTGEMTLFNYVGTATTIVVTISEEGNQNYKGLNGARLSVIINAPGDKGPDGSVSRSDFPMEPVGTIYDSRLNHNYFKDLKETRVSFAGVGTVKANDDQLQKFGAGVNLIIKMKPVGEDATFENTKQVMYYAQRFDGCSSSYNRTSVANGTANAVAMDDDIACPYYGSVTQRYLTFTVVSVEPLTPGAWEAVTPFVVYRHSNREFMPSPQGGCYTTGGTWCSGATEPTSAIHEWSRVDLRLTKE